jgi:catalase
MKIWMFIITAAVAPMIDKALAGPLSETYERYEGGSLESEASLIEGLLEKFSVLQRANATGGRLHRGTHAKGICADAKFEVFEPGKPLLAVGLFKQAAIYPARVRFSNGSSSINSDRAPDARSLSFAVDLGQGRRQDFSMNNAPIFPIPSLRGFNVVLQVGFVRAGAFREAVAAGATAAEAGKIATQAVQAYFAKHPEEAPIFAQIQALGSDVSSRPADSYRTIRYWSGSAFKYGEAQAAKFAVTPCDGVRERQTPEGASDTYLQDDVREHLMERGESVCFDFHVQLLDASQMRLQTSQGNEALEPWQWVEDVSLDWDLAGAPFHKVGQLTIKPGSVYRDEVCDDVTNAFDVMTNSLPEHRGLGRINRGRSQVEQASQQRRGQ